MQSILLHMNNDFADAITSAACAAASDFLFSRATSLEECLEFIECTQDCVVMLQIKTPVCTIQNLFYALERRNLHPLLFFFQEVGEKRLAYYMTSPNIQPTIHQVRTLFETAFFPRFVCENQQSRITHMACESLAEYEMRMGRENALIEIIRGCSPDEFHEYRLRYHLDLRENGYYLFFHEQQYEEYLEHAANKDVYNHIGDLMKRDCSEILKRFSGGEVFDITLNLQCVIINDIEIHSEAGKNMRFSELIRQLLRVTSCQSSAHYLSGRVGGICQLRSAYDSYRAKKSSAFFQRNDYVQLPGTSNQNLGIYFERAQDLLHHMRDTIKFDITSPALINNLHELFFDVIKPSNSFSVYYYCIAVISYSLRGELPDASESVLGSLDPHLISFSSIEEQYGNLLMQISALQTRYSFMRQSKNSYVLKAVQYISEHYSERITVPDISDELHISSTYLSKVFKAQVGIGIINYLTSYRIEMAKKLLEDTEMMIYVVAEKVGFVDGRYFSKVFKNEVGMYPKRYRLTKRRS